ncbi:MAG TPA: NADH-quinone oxidoreductase subunit F [Deltaproteobacteria bacterium]|nr:MAG: NADH oxidoreductase (quinone) subunit F [Deltaproteobacteria bacterium GWA2_55_82]OGQ65125.1 MAG: NADH oxidoreductase (quinone) subunit F [Deltaproteobacteria bacterium RIFCSPLOWO2_02_FULL_55_12]OIJ74748.1 MAG: NADH oxidoreductase (quinone) subunit F [Deltaproteobacteria bacterium GWC2_55_46]HBG45674.1 NADH-quinone oxidoreductase subunit F [Deltaproteobacteria bacterium]HCY12133.1 NADH-quinone oxidoreductase subunit F [Deltaproteobacteria bacterium]
MTERPLTGRMRPDGEALDIAGYEKAGGYQALRRALRMSPKEVQDAVSASNLRGRGGAGFSTGIKWSFVPMGASAPRPKYLVANADEMEPGAFKDRYLLEGDPHQLIEGMIISAFAIEAEAAYVFIRWEYQLGAERVQKAISEAYERKYLGSDILGSGFTLDIRLHTGAGRYICGEETALLNALEGRRAIPRQKPPFPQTCGLWGRPTVVNNVETLCNVPHIVLNGAEWYKKLSRSTDGGTKLYGASGRVKRPGLWELPMGTTIREILEEHAGGMCDGYRLRAIMPGGASTEFLTAERLDVKMDFDSVAAAGSRLGTGTMVVMDDSVCPVRALHNLESFFSRESCGWCTPCREGLPWVEKTLEAIEKGEGEPEDLEILGEHGSSLWVGRTFCALAPGAMEPLRSALALFKDDFERHISEKRCPYR